MTTVSTTLEAPSSGASSPASLDEAPRQRTELPMLVKPELDSETTETRRTLRAVQLEEVLRLLGSLIAALAFGVLLFTQIIPWSGALPFVLVSYVAFLGFYTAVVGRTESQVTVLDRIAGVVVWSLALLLLTALVVVVSFTLARGSEAFLHWNFWVQDLSLAGPQQPLSDGGMLHAAIGTLIMIFFALAISVPLGITAAVFMAEFPGRLARVVRTVTEAMTALPSIICGLFIYATYILAFGFDKSGFAASLAVTIMITPIITRSADVVLRLVPSTLREASYAMGASRWHTLWHVVLPTCKSGLTTAIILGTARGIGETSPVLLTAGYTTYFHFNPFSGPMVSLPFATFTLVKSPEPTQIARGFGAAAVLMALVFVLFMIGRMIGGRGPGVLSPRGIERVRRANRRDLERFVARAQHERVFEPSDQVIFPLLPDDAPAGGRWTAR